jgi:hypothetical protein
MTEAPITLIDEVPPDRILSGRQAYETALDIVIKSAERELLIFDHDLATGGYSGLKRFEALYGFLGKLRQNRLTFILHDTAFITSRCPRLIGLLKLYSHAIVINQTNEQARPVKDTFVIADQAHYVRRFHIDNTRFRYALNDETGAQPLYEKFCELREASHEAVFATALGL